MKTKTITLTAHAKINPEGSRNTDKHEYRVEKITDSTEYLPGQIITQYIVDGLCASGRWKVTTVPVKVVV